VKIFIVNAAGEPARVCWTMARANQVARELETAGNCETKITSVEIDNLCIPLREYYNFRGYKFPDTVQAFLFLASEIGELSDRIVTGQSDEWVRNHPEAKHSNLKPEIGDVLMMLTALCSAEYGSTDPIDCMIEKWSAKGFSAD